MFSGLCCIGSLNSHYPRGGMSAFPRFYGCAIDVKTGDVFPAVFPEKGPGET